MSQLLPLTCPSLLKKVVTALGLALRTSSPASSIILGRKEGGTRKKGGQGEIGKSCVERGEKAGGEMPSWLRVLRSSGPTSHRPAGLAEEEAATEQFFFFREKQLAKESLLQEECFDFSHVRSSPGALLRLRLRC